MKFHLHICKSAHFLILLLICSFAYSQTISRQLYGSAGSNAVAINGTYYVNWSMGEPVIHTLNNDLPQLTQGFQQPEIIIPLEIGKIELAVRRSEGDAFLSWKDQAEGVFVYQVSVLQIGTGWQRLGETPANIFRHYDIPDIGGALFYRVIALGQNGSIRHSNFVELKVSNYATPSVFPNPTSGLINLSNLPQNSHFQLYDMTGKLLIDQKSSSQDIQVDLSTLPSAVYLLRVQAGESSFSYKVEVKRK